MYNEIVSSFALVSARICETYQLVSYVEQSTRNPARERYNVYTRGNACLVFLSVIFFFFSFLGEETGDAESMILRNNCQVLQLVTHLYLAET